MRAPATIAAQLGDFRARPRQIQIEALRVFKCEIKPTTAWAPSCWARLHSVASAEGAQRHRRMAEYPQAQTDSSEEHPREGPMREFTRRATILAVARSRGLGDRRPRPTQGNAYSPAQLHTPRPAQRHSEARPRARRAHRRQRRYPAAALANPGVDADMISASLKKIGFSVTVKKDVALDGFEKAINDFAETARGADIALFYFVGHGFSIAEGGQQQNLLMATDANFEAKTASGLRSGGEPIEHVEETIIGHARATLMFIDASRAAPTMAASDGIKTRGFATINSSKFDGAFVVLSTREGKTASDGAEGQGSPFARAVATVLPMPGIRIEDAYYRIRDKVRAETSGQQVPDVLRSDLPDGGLALAPGDAH